MMAPSAASNSSLIEQDHGPPALLAYPMPEMLTVALKLVPGMLYFAIMFFRLFSKAALTVWVTLLIMVGIVDTLFVAHDGHFWAHMAIAFAVAYPSVQLFNTDDGLIHLARPYAVCSAASFGILMFFELRQASIWGFHGSNLAHLTIYFSFFATFASAQIGRQSSFYEWRKLHDPIAWCAKGSIIWKHVHDQRPIAMVIHAIQGKAAIAMGVCILAAVFVRGNTMAPAPSAFLLLQKLLGTVMIFNSLWLIVMSYLLYLAKEDDVLYGVHFWLWTGQHHGNADEAATIYCCIVAWASVVCACVCNLMHKHAGIKYEQMDSGDMDAPKDGTRSPTEETP